MLGHVLEVAIAPLLVGVASLVAVRFGPRAGGLVSAFPAIVGPFLLLSVDRHGAAFAADAADGTLLGLVPFAGFVVAYAWMATVSSWPTSLLVAWATAAGLAAAVSPVQLSSGWSVVVGVIVLVVAHQALPSRLARAVEPVPPWWDVPLRMLLCAALVVSLSLAADSLGSGAGGLLAALPVLASILAVFTHRDNGPAATVALLRGMLEGMAAFVAFCAVIGLAIVPWATVWAFVAAIAAAILADVVMSRLTPSDSL
jgi:hypothetical protein